MIHVMPNARRIAADILYELLDGKQTLDTLLNRAEPKLSGLPRPERALTHALIFGVLRWQGQLDWILGRLLQHPKRKLDPWIRIVLRLGLFQIHHLDRVPDSAAVNTAVELVKSKHKWAAGFVNGVLRSAARQTRPLPFPDSDQDPINALAVRHAFPSWLISRWLDRWGMETTQALCSAVNRIPPITIRTNTLKTTRSALCEALQSEVKALSCTNHSPEGIQCTSALRPIPAWTAYREGWFQIQDEAAQIVGHLLAPQPGHRVWDVCAGLGTKTAHLAQLMDDRGRLTASDLDPLKLASLETEMQRLGITCVETGVLDATGPVRFADAALYDRILVDAPCTGLGVLQKNPDGKWRTRIDDIDACARRQLRLLSAACEHLRPEGILVYAVCSMEPEENEILVRSFLQNHPEFVIHLPDITSVANARKLMTSEGFLRTQPHHHKMDGFFAAALRRRNRRNR